MRNSSAPTRRVSPGSSGWATMAEQEDEADQPRAQQRERTRLGNGIGAGEEERIDQPGRIDTPGVDITQPGKHSVECIAARGQEKVVAEFAVGVGPACPLPAGVSAA